LSQSVAGSADNAPVINQSTLIALLAALVVAFAEGWLYVSQSKRVARVEKEEQEARRGDVGVGLRLDGKGGEGVMDQLESMGRRREVLGAGSDMEEEEFQQDERAERDSYEIATTTIVDGFNTTATPAMSNIASTIAGTTSNIRLRRKPLAPPVSSTAIGTP
jgi:hypothetical protein